MEGWIVGIDMKDATTRCSSLSLMAMWVAVD